PEWKPEAEMAGVPLNETLPLPPLTRPEAGSDAMAFMLRFFFSALVDADWLTTESFMRPAQTQQRQTFPDDILVRMKDALEKSYQESFGEAEMTPVNVARQEVQEACLSASGNETGFFSLTVPTGGGKTLASLLFALNHA